MTSSGSTLPPAVEGKRLELEDQDGKPLVGFGRAEGEGAPVLLVHSVNAAGTTYEVKTIYDHFAGRRPVYAFDLPGFGLSDRSDRTYSVELMTDAVQRFVDEVRRRHEGPIHVLAVSLACEFLARAASRGEGYRSIALVSPTGLDGKGRKDAPAGTTRAMPTVHRVVSWDLWADSIYDNLTRPSVVRFFLEKTFGQKTIDEGMWAYDVKTARQPGAKHAPLYFLSGYLFSADITPIYERLEGPVWMCHGVRGDFVDYRGADRFRDRWTITTYQTGALPHFEVEQAFMDDYEAFLAEV